MSDYERIKAEIINLGGDRINTLGYLDGVMYEACEVTGHGFVLASKKGKVGIYAFVGKDGAPVEDDIAFIRSLALREAVNQ